MKVRPIQTSMALLIAGLLTLSVNTVQAQDTYSPLMAGLEQPYSQPLFESLSGDLSRTSAIGRQTNQIEQQGYAVYAEQVIAPVPMSCQNCGNLACSDSQVCADVCAQEQSWLQRRCQKMNRKCYFNYHSYHPKALHPIVNPACQPGFGYYETCWRKIAPNPCYCQPEYLPVMSSEPIDRAPASEGEPLPPAPAYDR